MPSHNLHVDLQMQKPTHTCLTALSDLAFLYSWINVFWKEDSKFRPLSKFYYMLHCKKLRC